MYWCAVVRRIRWTTLKWYSFILTVLIAAACRRFKSYTLPALYGIQDHRRIESCICGKFVSRLIYTHGNRGVKFGIKIDTTFDSHAKRHLPSGHRGLLSFVCHYLKLVCFSIEIMNWITCVEFESEKTPGYSGSDENRKSIFLFVSLPEHPGAF